MNSVNIENLKIELLKITKDLNFDTKQELSNFIDVEIIQTIEKENNIFELKDVYEYIENVDEFRDCVNQFINNFKIGELV